MLTARPRILDPDLEAIETLQSPPRSAAPAGGAAEPPVDHHCQICPTCGQRLTSHRCKLICTHCGYYLSCADYY